MRKPKNYLVYTSAGDQTNLNSWLGGERNFDLWITYYGSEHEKYKEIADYYNMRQGGKFPNLLHVYKNFYPILSQYEAILVIDDDIIINTEAINQLFYIRKKYDLWLLQPAFDPSGKVSHPITQANPLCFFRYTNFVEVTCPLFKWSQLDYFMKLYDPILVGWGIDWWFLEVFGLDLNNKVAIIDSIPCINPHDTVKMDGIREIDKLQPSNQRHFLWTQIKKKHGITSEERGFQEYTQIPLKENSDTWFDRKLAGLHFKWLQQKMQIIKRIAKNTCQAFIEIMSNDLLRNKPIIEKTYFQVFDRELDFKKNYTFNTYIQSTKLDKHNEHLWQFTDKYAVRSYVANLIGRKYLVNLLGVWSQANQIDYDQLPRQFVLKTNHGSGWNIIVKDYALSDREKTHQLLNEWMSKNYYDVTMEPHYRRIQPKIFAEEYLADVKGELLDYNFFCFYGQPCFVQVDIGRLTNNHTRVYFDLDWRPLPFSTRLQISHSNINKPINFSQMIEIAAILSKPHTHVRVDLYNIDGRILFSELTFTHESGFGKFYPDDTYDFLLGDIIKKFKKPEEIFNCRS